MSHDTSHPNAGQTVTLKHALKDDSGELVGGAEFRLEDWWDRAAGISWMLAEGNPAALKYAIRSAINGLPTDDEVVYGKLDSGLGHIVHVSELELAPPAVLACGCPGDTQVQQIDEQNVRCTSCGLVSA